MSSRIIFYLYLLCIISIFISLCLFLNSSKHNYQKGKGNRRPPDFLIRRDSDGVKENEVFILSKANVGQYVWHHILNATSYFIRRKMWQIGDHDIDGISYKFFAGPGLIPTTAPKHIKHLVLILNGRTKSKVASSKLWLDYLSLFKNLKKVGVILLGNEECDNNWILPYVESNGGPVAFVFFIYDSPLVNDRDVFQWPLGVADYRGFPKVNPVDVDVYLKRPYICNFMGTVYKNSSRRILYDLLRHSHLNESVFLNGRDNWSEGESEESMKKYFNVLKNSDFTLNPVGMNSECYRIYEAMSVGSVPVVENIVTPGGCSRTADSPLRLLKKYRAPIVYINKWNNILDVVRDQLSLSQNQLIKQRIKILNWYTEFKRKMKHQFHRVVKSKFSIVSET